LAATSPNAPAGAFPHVFDAARLVKEGYTGLAGDVGALAVRLVDRGDDAAGERVEPFV
jgi:hypothetical protein